MNKKIYKKIILISIFSIIAIISIVFIIKSKSTTETIAKKEEVFAEPNTEETKNEENKELVVYLSNDEEDENTTENIEENIVNNIVNNNEEVENVQSNQNSKPTTSNQTSNSSRPIYYIKINYQANVVTIYTKDSNGNYTIPYKAMVCSTGTATPTGGVYTIPKGSGSKGTWGLMFGNVWAQYYTRIKGSILFHSVPYTARNKSTLEYWEYDKLGTTASAGCIRLTVQDAKWIYDNCPSGTQVEFYADSNPGPLGKPSAQKISNESESVRGWDPTDASSENPWRTYQPITIETNTSPVQNNTDNSNNVSENTPTQNQPSSVESDNQTSSENTPIDNTQNSSTDNSDSNLDNIQENTENPNNSNSENIQEESNNSHSNSESIQENTEKPNNSDSSPENLQNNTEESDNLNNKETESSNTNNKN